MGRCWRQMKKMWPLAATLFSLSVLAYHVILQRFVSFTDCSYGQLSLDSDQVKLKRSLLAAGVDEIETDPTFAQVVHSVPEISEQALFESMKLKNLKIYVYKLPAIFNEDQVKLNARRPPKIWDPNCTTCLLYTSPSPRDATLSRMPSSA